jgi:hypothetical protein
MSTPFPLEQQSQEDTSLKPSWNPWSAPEKPQWYSGMGFTEDTAYLGPLYRIAAMPGSAAAKGELLLSGGMHAGGNTDLSVDESGGLTGTESADQSQPAADAVEADARMRIKALRPDPNTTGVAVQALHTLGEGATTMIAGSLAGGPVGAFAALSSSEGYSSYKDLIEQGVDPKTAREIAMVRGGTAGAGAVMPMVFGTALATRLLTGAVANTAFGMVNRELDSTLLRSNGYGEMADQEQVFDRTQMLIDLTLGVGFGGIHHLTAEARPAAERLAEAMSNDSALRDAALTANLAIHDRQSGPGVPVTPGDMNAHIAALEKSMNDLQDRKPVDVSGTGVEDSTVITRGGQVDPAVHDIIRNVIAESGLLEETHKADQLEAVLNRKLSGEPEPTPKLQPELKQEHLEQLPDLQQAQLKDMYDAAAAAKPSFDATLGQIARDTNGEAKLAALKGSKRAVDKIRVDYQGDATKINDILRGTVEVKSPQDLKAATDAIRSRFEVVRETNRAERPGPDGYRDVMFKVRTPNGHVGEVQINVPHMLKAKADVGHKLYAEREAVSRKASAENRPMTADEMTRFRDLNARMKELYDSAWEEAAKASNSAADKGMPLRLSESNGNRREPPEETSNARQSKPPSEVGTVATGTPSTSNISEPLGRVEETRTGAPAGGLRVTKSPPTGDSLLQSESSVTDVAHQALSERPDLTIADSRGTEVQASDALHAANAEVSRTTREAPSMFKAAIDCFMRRGS